MKRVAQLVVCGSVLFPLGMLLVVSLGLLSSEQGLSRQQIEHIQRALCCEESGALDANTRQALRSYQQTRGLAPNTVLDRAQIARLLDEPPCKADRRNYYENTLSREQIRSLQRKLQVAPSGEISGWTRRAVQAFQARLGQARRDGVLNAELQQAILQADEIPITTAEPLYGLGIAMEEGSTPWVRINQLSELPGYPVGTRLTLTSLGVNRRSIEVEVQGTFREENPRKIVQISRQASRLLQLGGRQEVALMIQEAPVP